jgi:ribose transport system permease protein
MRLIPTSAVDDAPTLGPQGDEDEPLQPIPRWRRLAAPGSAIPIGIVLLGFIAVFAFLEGDRFLTPANVRNISMHAAVLLVLAVGQTFVIITAGIDLSVGAILVFAAVASANAMEIVGGNDWWTILVGLIAALIAGGLWGAWNGFLVAKARITAFVATLGTLGMALGLSLVITGGVDERNIPMKLVETVGTGRLFGEIPWLVIISVVVTVCAGILLAKTRFGRHTYATGSNKEAARRASVPVDRHLIRVYALAGCLYGLGGFLSIARFATTTVAGHNNDNLQTITAVVIGGTSLFGGIGSILGTAFGVLIPAVLPNGCVIRGIEPFWQQVALGAVLVLAVYLDRLRRSP